MKKLLVPFQVLILGFPFGRPKVLQPASKLATPILRLEKALVFKNFFLCNLLAVTCLFSCGQGKKIEQRSTNNLARPTLVVNYDIERVKNKIISTFKTKYNNQNNSSDIFSHFHLSHKNDGPGLFPGDLSLKAWATEYFDISKELVEYINIAPEKREYDIYLYNMDIAFWESEYYLDGKPVKFKTNFFIHLSTISSTKTEIQIFQYQPQIWVGEKFGIGHAGDIGMRRDVRWVRSTIKDSIDLLNLIKSWI